MRGSWRLVELASRMLETGEREVVLGDLIEQPGTASEALRDVFGLVMMRQARIWMGWRPWVSLAGIILPLGIVLSVVSHSISAGNAVTLWLTANNWDAYLLHNGGFWSGVRDSLPGVFLAFVAIGCWSWTCGFAAGALSRRAVWSIGTIFCAVFVVCAVPGILSGLEYDQAIRQAAVFRGNEAVFRIAFYRWMLPLAVQIGLVALPAARGLWDGARMRIVPRRVNVAIRFSALVTVASLITQGLTLWQVSLRAIYPLHLPRLPLLLPFAVLGPMVHLLSVAGQRKRMRRA